MRIAIIGAGIAGTTLAGLLGKRGVHVDIVERAPSFDHAGYMLGLYSLGSRVLHGLGLFERFCEESYPLVQYDVRDGHGERIKLYDMTRLTERVGAIRNCTRPRLLRLLCSSVLDPIRMGVAFESLEQDDREVRVKFSDGTEGAYDVVVAADGIHSGVRRQLFGEQPAYDTKWGGWVWFTDRVDVPDDFAIDHYGAGTFVGLYPTIDGVGVFAGAPMENDFDKHGTGRGDRIRARLAGMGALVDSALEGLPSDDTELFFWHLADARSHDWVSGRVVLLGDAASGFLPTAGVGASMAMESAAVLDDELGRADAATIPHALALFQARRKKRVETIQGESRSLAKIGFVKSKILVPVRDFAIQFYEMDDLIKQIARSFDEPISITGVPSLGRLCSAAGRSQRAVELRQDVAAEPRELSREERARGREGHVGSPGDAVRVAAAAHAAHRDHRHRRSVRPPREAVRRCRRGQRSPRARSDRSRWALPRGTGARARAPSPRHDPPNRSGSVGCPACTCRGRCASRRATCPRSRSRSRARRREG